MTNTEQFAREQIAFYNDMLKRSDERLKKINGNIKWCRKENHIEWGKEWESHREWEYKQRRWYRKQRSLWVNSI